VKREKLKEMGLDDEKIEAVIKEYEANVAYLKTGYDKAAADAAALAKAAADKEAALAAELEAAKAGAAKAAKEHALEVAMVKAGARNPKAVRALVPDDADDYDAALAALRESDSYLFAGDEPPKEPAKPQPVTLEPAPKVDESMFDSVLEKLGIKGQTKTE
jgi:hypothetical protein